MPLRNVLFVMADQLRWDHLGCAGHPYLRTPNIDAFAARGTRFTHAFAQSGVCGPSRMSFYTGRYPISHGATWNLVPLSIGERTLGALLHPHGRSVHLCGKSHVVPDRAAIERLGLGADTVALAASGGFVEWFRYDGHRAPAGGDPYALHLITNGYASAEPWTDFVIATVDERGDVHSGWAMRHVGCAARVREEDSETAYTTDRAIECLRAIGDRPWVLHLSYIKPHWPYVAPAPYHALYDADHCLPARRAAHELDVAHPVVAAYREHDESRAFQDEACIRTVRPVYQGLVAQLDHHLGRLFEFLDRSNATRDTLIVFASDHGDLLGDHWLGEKELFYDAVQRIPLIISDPRASADATRGTSDDRLVEAVDVLPTMLDAIGVPVDDSVEGESLLPALHGQDKPQRRFVYSELDYGFRKARVILRRRPMHARGFSLRDRRWRYVNWLDLPEQLFDLANDPDEFQDLGREPLYAGVRESMRRELGDFMMRRRSRTTLDEEEVEAATDRHRENGIRLGEW